MAFLAARGRRVLLDDLEHLAQRRRHDVELHSACFDLGQVKDLVDQVEQVFPAVENIGQELTSFLVADLHGGVE